jgi:hypothetical protein
MLLEETFPADVTKTQAQRRHAELNVDLLERIASERPNDAQAAHQLAKARGELERLRWQ